MRRRDDFQKRLPNDLIQCEVCPQSCKLADGKRGRCYAVKREGDSLVLTSYGHSSGFCVDPIEKKPLNHFLPGTPILSFGTTGCNLTCQFCQNWDISMNRRMERLSERAEPEDIARKARELGCRSIACTYNEPVVFLEYAVDVAQAASELGIKTVLVTNGYVHSKARELLYGNVDAANVDLKAFRDSFYKNLCGASLEPVLDTLRYIRHETRTWLEITTLLIPGENDSDKELSDLCDWVLANLGPDVPIHFTAFHPDNKMQQLPRTPIETLIRARRLAMDAGVSFVYTGNIYNPSGEKTHCPECNQLLIDRSGYEICSWHISHGCCDNCGIKIPGVFETNPGDWGNRRLPVRI